MALPLKAGVDARFLSPQIVRVLWNVQAIMEYHGGPDYQFVITAGRDGKHKTGSKHYSDEAIDIRTRPMPLAKQQEAVSDMKALLDRHYDIVLEVDHIHLEYDP